MLRKRIIPCLDVRGGKVVKGVNFENVVEMGSPDAHASFYDAEGADELVILDITASKEARQTMVHVVESVADSVFIPLTVGGGIRTADDVREMLNAGADRVSLNTAAVKNPDNITESATRFGSQCVIVAVDVKRRENANGWDVYIYGGSQKTELDAIAWVKEAECRGAGEILLTSMDRDGTKSGYDIELLRAVTSSISIPVIASGGAGTMQHFAEALNQGGADAVLAASLFHSRMLSVPLLKTFLKMQGVGVR